MIEEEEKLVRCRQMCRLNGIKCRNISSNIFSLKKKHNKAPVLMVIERLRERIIEEIKGQFLSEIATIRNER